jgi:hypothetical protein
MGCGASSTAQVQHPGPSEPRDGRARGPEKGRATTSLARAPGPVGTRGQRPAHAAQGRDRRHQWHQRLASPEEGECPGASAVVAQQGLQVRGLEGPIGLQAETGAISRIRSDQAGECAGRLRRKPVWRPQGLVPIGCRPSRLRRYVGVDSSVPRRGLQAKGSIAEPNLTQEERDLYGTAHLGVAWVAWGTCSGGDRHGPLL